MNSTVQPSFKVVFLKKKEKKKVLAGLMNNAWDPLNAGRTKHAWLAAIQTYT